MPILGTDYFCAVDSAPRIMLKPVTLLPENPPSSKLLLSYATSRTSSATFWYIIWHSPCLETYFSSSKLDIFNLLHLFENLHLFQLLHWNYGSKQSVKGRKDSPMPVGTLKRHQLKKILVLDEAKMKVHFFQLHCTTAHLLLWFWPGPILKWWKWMPMMNLDEWF